MASGSTFGGQSSLPRFPVPSLSSTMGTFLESARPFATAGEFEAALGKVPILYVDGVALPQSKAMERYVAKQVGLMGSTPMEEAQIDAICEHQRDIRDAFGKVDGMPKVRRENENF